MTDRHLDANRDLWDAWTELHVDSDFYDLESFRAGETSLKSIELEELGDVAGLDLLHLQCHFGLDTLSWARLGARVTGVDLSPKAVEVARRLAEEAGLDARFVAGDVLALDELVSERFDVVFTSYGVLDWLRDLDAWAGVVARRLRPGGVFYLVEFHPLLGTLSEDGHSFAEAYFPQDEPIVVRERGSYADPDAPVEGFAHVWPHSLGEIVSALLGAGLALDFLHEFPDSPYDCYPFTQEVEPGRAVIPGLEGRLPLVFSLRARLPEAPR